MIPQLKFKFKLVKNSDSDRTTSKLLVGKVQKEYENLRLYG